MSGIRRAESLGAVKVRSHVEYYRVEHTACPMSVSLVRRLLAVSWIFGSLFCAPTPTAAQGRIVPVPPAEYAERRDSLAARIGPGAVFAFGAVEPILSKHGFDQLPSFQYLTGFMEPDAALLLESDGTRARTTLFTAPYPIRKQFYEGFAEDHGALARRTGMRVRDLSEFRAAVDSLVAAGVALHEVRDVRSNDVVRRDTLTRGAVFVADLESRHPGLAVGDAYRAVWQLRARKSGAEASLVRAAIAVTDSAHVAAMRMIRPGVHEYEVQSVIESTFRRLGADGLSFGSIVGSGKNSTILHYRAGDREMRDGEVVVMDIGAQWDGYDADITRTVPVSGRFSAESRAIYELVLAAQKAAEATVAPGRSSSEATAAAVRVRLEGLARLGLIEHPDSTYDPLWEADCVRSPGSCLQGSLFMIHGIGHGIGLEVHDAAAYGIAGRYAEGDHFTIEPGLYINADALAMLPDTPKNRRFLRAVQDTARRYHGIGVRIEDDYEVTATGVNRLSTAPREVGEIEAVLSERGY